MLIIAVTGGIGSGKSTVSELFSRYQVPIIDTDDIARELVKPGEPALTEISETFGRAYLNNDGTLNRRKLRERIFADEQAKKKLEAILHPKIRTSVMRKIQTMQADYCLIVIPLLVGNTQNYPYDRVLLIDTNTATQIQRVAARDMQDEATTRKMLAAQADRASLLAIADDIIDNNGTPDELAGQVAQLHEKYLALSRYKRTLQ